MTNTKKVTINENEYILFTKLDKYSYDMTKYEDGFKLSYAIISNEDYSNLMKKYN